MKTVTEVVKYFDSLIDALTEQFQLQKEGSSLQKKMDIAKLIKEHINK